MLSSQDKRRQREGKEVISPTSRYLTYEWSCSRFKNGQAFVQSRQDVVQHIQPPPTNNTEIHPTQNFWFLCQNSLCEKEVSFSTCHILRLNRSRHPLQYCILIWTVPGLDAFGLVGEYMISLRRRRSMPTSSGERRNGGMERNMCSEARSVKQLNGTAFIRPTNTL